MRRQNLVKAITLVAALSLLAVFPSVGVGAEGEGGDGGDFAPFVSKASSPAALEAALFTVEGVFFERGLAEARKFGEIAAVRIDAGRVEVEVFPTGSPAAAFAAVTALGGEVTYGGPAFPVVVAMMPLGRLSDLADDPAVSWVQAPPQPFPEAAVTGEGVAASGADAWHAAGYLGQGQQIAILDNGFGGLAAAQASGDLPATVKTVNYCAAGIGGDTVHGTGVAEIVHEMAPEAQLWLICSEGTADIGRAIGYMNRKGIDVFNHSVGYFNTQRGDGSGVFGQLGNKANRYDIVWVNSAGNYAQNHWSGNFAEGTLPGDPDGIHNFTVNDEGNAFSLADGSEVNVMLRWDDWPTSSNDFDLYLYQKPNMTTPVASSVDLQTGTQAPTERLSWTNTTGSTQTYDVVIEWYGALPGPALDFDLFVLSPQNLEHVVTPRSLNDPSTVVRILATAAVNHADNTWEYYSSQGPTIDGRLEPDLAGYARVSNTTYPGTFWGTSAAAPHVTGAAALVRQAWPQLNSSQVRIKLQQLTTDNGAVGRDNLYGEGYLTLGTPPPLPRCGGVAVTIWGSGDDDVINGTVGDDVIMGFGGADQIDGRGGIDRICGGDGDDIITGGLGNDRIYGDAGDDLLSGGAGNDRVFGGDGNDRIDGGVGNDVLKGEGGDDHFIGGTGGSDTFNGAAGRDQVDYSAAANGVDIDLDGGSVVDRAINDTLIRVENAVGSQFDDRLLGTDGPNTLIGQGGDDLILGRGGNDRLYGGTGHDALRGEAGDDALRGEAGDDRLWGGAGIDRNIGGAGTDVCREGETNLTCETIL